MKAYHIQFKYCFILRVKIIITFLFFLLFENSILLSQNYSLKKSEKLIDIDGNTYRTVTIGNQIWMAENLKTTRYRDSAEIQLIIDFEEWVVARYPARCWYNNDSIKYKDKYGALYNWFDKSANTDAFGFSARPTGERSNVTDFDEDKYAAYWWSSTSWSFLFAWAHHITSDNDIITRYPEDKVNGFSVRCIKNNSD